MGLYDLWSQPPGHADGLGGNCHMDIVIRVDRFQSILRQTGVTLLVDNDVRLSSHNKYDCTIEERGERDRSAIDEPEGSKSEPTPFKRPCVMFRP